MLKIMRKKGVAKKVLWVIAGIIIISFGFGFGMSRYSSSLSVTSTVGKVFGKPVSFKDFEKYSYDTRDQAMIMHGENFRKIQHLIDMDNETWTRIILLKEAERRHIKTADEEVITYIQSLPFFLRDGEFDQRTYEYILRNVFQRDPREFEEGIRDQIKIVKLFRAETSAAVISDDKVRQEYERRNKKTQVSYLLIDPKTFAKDVPVSEDEIKTFYNEHRADFLTPDSVNVAYMAIDFPIKATEADKTKALEKAKEIRKQITGDTDFAAVAKENGLAVRESGLISMEDSTAKLSWPLELLQKVFAAKAGEVLAPYATGTAVIIAQIKDLKPAYIPELDKAREAVQDRIRGDRAGALAQSKAEEVLKELTTRLAAKETIETAAAGLGQSAKKTPFFTFGEYIPEVGISEDFGSAALELSKDKRLSGVVTTAKGPAILYWEADEPVDEKKFAEAKADFTKTLDDEARIAAMNKVIREAKERAKLETYLDKFKKK
jgi:peptidyl-prolyl cis-trans isomerase D